MSVRAITLDFWGTLLLDPPSSDNRYKARRMRDFENILAGAGVRVTGLALDRAYEASAVYLSRIWGRYKDVPVVDHVRTILGGVETALPGRVPPDVLAALVDAYSRPALIVPPALDAGAPKALTALREEGYTLALVSNTMRTPGTTLRQLLERFGLLRLFAHTVFSDEVGIRKPDPAIFRGALDAVGADAATAIHVGDDGLLDVGGARAAGMRVIQVTNAALNSLGGRRPDAVIPSLIGLPDAVAQLDR
ncbi:MAG TPA: HAD-IA family hydrolase [Methylomirabilota bacterium]|nr:HAD-IA family hydrolase [Methylomirabilota bacterium]